MNSLSILALIFFSVTLFVMLIMWILYKRIYSVEYQARKRLEDFSKEKKISSSDMPFILRDDQLSRIPTFNRFLQKLNISKLLKKYLQQADMNMKVGELILLMIVLAVVGVLITLQMNNIIIKVAIPAVMAIIPLLNVILKRNKRLSAFNREFPDAIDMMTSAIKSGHTFNKAMQLVAGEAPDPVGMEFRRTFEEYNLGLQLREVLVNMTERIESPDLKLFVTAILLQKETGGNLTEILEKISHTIRERFKLLGQIQTYTAQARMSGWILGLLPVIFVLIIMALHPDYLDPLFNDKLGHLLIVIAVFLQLVGFLIIRKIMNIKFE